MKNQKRLFIFGGQETESWITLLKIPGYEVFDHTHPDASNKEIAWRLTQCKDLAKDAVVIAHWTNPDKWCKVGPDNITRITSTSHTERFTNVYYNSWRTQEDSDWTDLQLARAADHEVFPRVKQLLHTGNDWDFPNRHLPYDFPSCVAEHGTAAAKHYVNYLTVILTA